MSSLLIRWGGLFLRRLMDFSFFEKIVIEYLQKNPELIERLLDALVKYALARLTA